VGTGAETSEIGAAGGSICLVFYCIIYPAIKNSFINSPINLPLQTLPIRFIFVEKELVLPVINIRG